MQGPRPGRHRIGRNGDITRAGDTEAVSAAAEKARADRVLRAVPGGLNGYVGHSYADGTDLPGGSGRRWAWPAP